MKKLKVMAIVYCIAFAGVQLSEQNYLLAIIAILAPFIVTMLLHSIKDKI